MDPYDAVSLWNVPHRASLDHVTDYEQAHAVDTVYVADHGSTPYLIGDSPGTAITKSPGELAIQPMHTTSNAHLFICADWPVMVVSQSRMVLNVVHSRGVRIFQPALILAEARSLNSHLYTLE